MEWERLNPYASLCCSDSLLLFMLYILICAIYLNRSYLCAAVSVAQLALSPSSYFRLRHFYVKCKKIYMCFYYLLHFQIFQRLSEVISSEYYITKHVCLEVGLPHRLSSTCCIIISGETYLDSLSNTHTVASGATE